MRAGILRRVGGGASGLSLLLLAGLCLLSFGAPVWIEALSLDPSSVRPGDRYLGISSSHWLGTDELGRDFLSRLFLGGRVSLTVAGLSTVLTSLVGISFGLSAGFVGGRLDALFLSCADVLRSLPKLPLMIFLLAMDPNKMLPESLAGDPSRAALFKLVLIITVFGWPSVARLARAEALRLRDSDFVLAGRALGLSSWRVLRDHVLPNALGPLVVAVTLEVGQLVVYESVLSFLGLGVQPPTPSWGAMLRDGLGLIQTAPLLILAPGLLTLLTVACVNVLGDGLRDALDPRRPETRED